MTMASFIKIHTHTLLLARFIRFYAFSLDKFFNVQHITMQVCKNPFSILYLGAS